MYAHTLQRQVVSKRTFFCPRSSEITSWEWLGHM